MLNPIYFGLLLLVISIAQETNGKKPSEVHVVGVAIKLKNGRDFPKFNLGLKRLARNPSLKTYSESGQTILEATDELQLENALRALEKNIHIRKSAPFVSYRETVGKESSQTSMCRSPNKLNRLYVKAVNMPEGLSEDIVKGVISPGHGSRLRKRRAKLMAKKYGYDKDEAMKIWTFGPSQRGPNLLFDVAKDVQYLNDIKDSVVASFQKVTYAGPLCGERMRGVRFNILNAKLSADSIYRGTGQMFPTALKVFYASFLRASPKLMEPIYRVEIKAQQAVKGGIHAVLSHRRGKIIEAKQSAGMVTVKAHLPVAESFGFSKELKSKTHGKASKPTISFDHWQIVDGNPLAPASKAGKIVAAIRKRKGLKGGVPS